MTKLYIHSIDNILTKENNRYVYTLSYSFKQVVPS